MDFDLRMKKFSRQKKLIAVMSDEYAIVSGGKRFNFSNHFEEN
jgi:hypothetical protein